MVVVPQQGTLFRLPLRTEEQAREGRLSAHAYTVDDMLQLLNRVRWWNSL